VWLDTLIESVVKAVAKFSRKSPPDKSAGWNRDHFDNIYGFCIYCGKRRGSRGKCEGPRP